MGKKIQLKPQETLWVQYIVDGEVKYVIITKNRLRETYHFCQVNDNGNLIEVAKSNNPLELEQKYHNLFKKESGAYKI